MKGLKTLHFVSTDFLNSLILPKVPRSFREWHVEYSRLDLLKKVGGRRLCFTFVSIHKHSARTFQSLFLPSSVPTEVTQFYERSRKELRVEARSRSPHVSQVTDLWFRESWESREPYNFVPNPHARTPRELTRLLILSLRQGECCTELKLTTWKLLITTPLTYSVKAESYR